MAKRIAVVDDDTSVCKGLSRLLRSAGYQSISFSSDEECLASGQLSEVDCFLLDIYLGNVMGFALARALRDAGVKAPVIFMTAQDESITRDAIAAAGSPVCLRKPMDSEVLFAAIAVALANPV